MANASLEERVSAIESELAEIKTHMHILPVESSTPWWDQIYGSFANSDEYDEAMRLGREYRQSQRPTEDEAA